LKKRREDINIRELFRRKLGNAEIIPDPSVSIRLMRKLARREFLRFNPARFNIYYLGGIILAVITSAIILSSGGKEPDKLIQENHTGEVSNAVVIKNMNAPVEQNVTHKSDELDERTINPKESTSIKRLGEAQNETENNKVIRENPIVLPANVNDSFARKSIFKESSPDMNKLQSGFTNEDILFELSAYEGCIPLKLYFRIKSELYDSCRWTFGDGGYSNEKNPEWIFDVEGDYKVVLNLFGPDGTCCTSSSIIKVYPNPVARFEIAPEKAIIPEDEIRFYNYSTNTVNFKWDFGDGTSSVLYEPLHRYSKSGNYNIRLIVTSDKGCSDSLTVMNAFSGSEFFIDFPNAFIPNIQGPTGGYYSSKSDEAAEVFHPAFFGVSNYQLKIFSKLGILIFESSDVSLGWDGYLNGQLCEPGVYIWKVRGNFRNGEPFTKMGDVTLLRN
jgi:PKD repeat protein